MKPLLKLALISVLCVPVVCGATIQHAANDLEAAYRLTIEGATRHGVYCVQAENRGRTFVRCQVAFPGVNHRALWHVTEGATHHRTFTAVNLDAAWEQLRLESVIDTRISPPWPVEEVSELHRAFDATDEPRTPLGLVFVTVALALVAVQLLTRRLKKWLVHRVKTAITASGDFSADFLVTDESGTSGLGIDFGKERIAWCAHARVLQLCAGELTGCELERLLGDRAQVTLRTRNVEIPAIRFNTSFDEGRAVQDLVLAALENLKTRT